MALPGAASALSTFSAPADPPPPTVTGVTPNDGLLAGLNVVSISGTNLSRASAVRFGSRSAIGFVAFSPNTIVALTPPGTGTVDVTVTTAGGTSAIGAADWFTYETPGEWAILSTPLLSTPDNALQAVSCSSLTFCMAVGKTRGRLVEVGQIEPGVQLEPLAEEWNGRAWMKLPAPPKLEPREQDFQEGVSLTGVSCTSPSFCAAVGHTTLLLPGPDSSGPGLLADTWNGSEWTQTDGTGLGGKTDLSGVSCVSSSFCMAVGSHGHPLGGPTQTRVETWSGKSWSPVPSPNEGEPTGEFSRENELYGVSCVSSSFCMAVGANTGFRSAPFGPRTLIESWNGAAWSIVPSPSRGTGDSLLDAVSCTSATHCMAIGGSGEGALVESWDGSSWTVLESPQPEGSGLNGVSCVSVTLCVFVGSDKPTDGAPSQTLVETLTGGVWSIVPSADGPSGSSALDGVSCVPLRWPVGSCTAAGSLEVTPEDPVQTLIETGGVW